MWPHCASHWLWIPKAEPLLVCQCWPHIGSSIYHIVFPRSFAFIIISLTCGIQFILPCVFSDAPHTVQTKAAQTGAHQGLPPDGGGVYTQPGEAQTTGGETGGTAPRTLSTKFDVVNNRCMQFSVRIPDNWCHIYHVYTYCELDILLSQGRWK